MAKISVCMATYNGEPFIHAQVASILQQLGTSDELVISDDRSTDGTLDVVRSFGDARIRIVFNEMAKGYSGNFENAIRHASGDIIFLSDQDDVWMPRKVERMSAALNEFDLVVSDARFVNGQLEGDGGTYFQRRQGKTGFLANLYKARYLGACMAFRSALLPKLLPFPGQRRLCPHDLWITLVGELFFKVGLVEEPLILYRRHGNNASDGGTARGGSAMRRVVFRLYSLMMVLSRAGK
jgi:glycosyltransferase involved in cell wall biosynthesis